jgi:hypothetical protein
MDYFTASGSNILRKAQKVKCFKRIGYWLLVSSQLQEAKNEFLTVTRQY